MGCQAGIQHQIVAFSNCWHFKNLVLGCFILLNCLYLNFIIDFSLGVLVAVLGRVPITYRFLFYRVSVYMLITEDKILYYNILLHSSLELYYLEFVLFSVRALIVDLVVYWVYYFVTSSTFWSLFWQCKVEYLVSDAMRMEEHYFTVTWRLILNRI